MGKNIKNAVEVLDENLASICTVAEWVEKLGYDSSKYFSRVFRNYYSIRPKEVLVERKVLHFKKVISTDPDLIHYSVAQKLGLKDEFSLYKFIKRHTGKSPTYWRKRIVISFATFT